MIKQLILLLWACWLSLVVVLNTMEGLRHAGRLPVQFKFASQNFASILRVTAIYSTPRWISWSLYVGVVIWEAVAATLLWTAFVRAASLPAVDAAFFVALGLWAGFIMADEFFLTFVGESGGMYSPAASHRSIFATFLISLLALHLLP